MISDCCGAPVSVGGHGTTHWWVCEYCGTPCDLDPKELSSCVLELRARVEALEADRRTILSTGSRLKVGLDAAQPAEPNDPAKPDRSLVERVSAAIHPSACADPNLYLHESRAAICAVQAWLIERKCQDDWLATFDEIVSLIELELRND
jgi:hypothetical protein